MTGMLANPLRAGRAVFDCPVSVIAVGRVRSEDFRSVPRQVACVSAVQSVDLQRAPAAPSDVVMVGSGGVFAEVLDDVAIRKAPPVATVVVPLPRFRQPRPPPARSRAERSAPLRGSRGSGEGTCQPGKRGGEIAGGRYRDGHVLCAPPNVHLRVNRIDLHLRRPEIAVFRQIVRVRGQVVRPCRIAELGEESRLASSSPRRMDGSSSTCRLCSCGLRTPFPTRSENAPST